MAAGHVVGNNDKAGDLALRVLMKIFKNAGFHFETKDGQLKGTVEITAVLPIAEFAPLQSLTTKSG